MRKILLSLGLACASLSIAQEFNASLSARYVDGREGACEISSYDESSKKLFITNAASDSIDIVSLELATNPVKVGGVNVKEFGGGVNSVVVLGNGYVAAAIEATVKQDTGFVVIFDVQGEFVSKVKVGALPDMITVSKDGNYIVVANEGEPNADYTVDPEGSISIIDISNGVANLTQENVTTLGFENSPASIEGSIKKPNTSYAVDLEPEYVAIDPDSKKAVVICQESNVFVFVDLVTKSIVSYKGLGFKDHGIDGNGIDASNKDDKIEVKPWNVKGVYQPDAITSTEIGGEVFYLSANEGDGRDYDGYSSETRIGKLVLDSVVFPNYRELQDDANLGRLKTFTADMIGDIDNDGDIDELYSYGARSFSIWNSNGELVWDSGDDFEKYIAANHPDFFNVNDGNSEKKDSRSDDKGIEPEAVTVGKLGDKIYAFVGLERQGGVMIYDISVPTSPVFVKYIHTIGTSNIMTDIAPEGILFVAKSEDEGMLIVSHEVSGTTTIYNVSNKINGVFGTTKKEASVYIAPSVVTESFQMKGNLGSGEKLTIFNSSGTVAKSLTVSAESKVDVSDLRIGSYFAKVKNKQGQLEVVKFVKQ